MEGKINQRLTELGVRITEAGIDAVLLLHHRDILYYAGTARPAALLVTPDNAVLFVRRGFDYAQQEATVARVEAMKGFSTVVAVIAELGLTGGVLGTEMDLVPAQIYQRLGESFPTWTMVDVTPMVLGQRMVKDKQEIAITCQTASIADTGHRVAAQVIAPGMSELALAAEVEVAIRRVGHEGYQPLRHPGARGGGLLLMSGEHLAVRGGHGLVVTGAGLGPAMPYGPSERVFKPGDLVVVDIGPSYRGYTADESRTFVVGQATASQRAFFDVARATEQAVFDMIRPGVPVADLYPVAEAVVAQGAPPYFSPGSLTLPGFVGHGIGLEIDEPPVLWPRVKTRLQVGMVLAIEIEVSAPEQGTMIKLEDTVVVQPDGYELLTLAPRELIECGV
ncbi:MAG: aminopeptidase P family protein [Chloroflexi bacterium]|nr:aminopeptidase P family protein [Chloroflexota bacterium]